jgi:hypothetical protein
MLRFQSQGWCAYSSFKSDYWNEKLVKLQYSISLVWFGKRKDALAYQLPKSAHCSYEDSFKLMVIKYAKETGDCTTAWKFCVTEQNTWHLRKQTELLLKGTNLTQKAFRGPKQGYVNVVDKNIME